MAITNVTPDPRASGTPHYFVVGAGSACSACGKRAAAAVHLKPPPGG